MKMNEKTQFATEPSALEYSLLPNGIADVWVRKNIERVEDTIDNGAEATDAVPYTYWTADEAYMQTSKSKADLEADIEAAFAEAEAWEYPPAAVAVSLAERVEALEALGLDMLAAMMEV